MEYKKEGIKPMEKRDFLQAIINSTIAQEYKDYALSELSKMDEKNAKRRTTLTPAQKENEVLKDKIVDFLKGCKIAVASEIAAALELSTAKVSALCGQLVKENRVVAMEVKFPKKSAVKGYFIPVDNNGENE